MWNSYAIKQSSPAIVWLSASVFPHWGERKLINVSFTCVNGNFKFPIHKKSQALVEKKNPFTGEAIIFLYHVSVLSVRADVSVNMFCHEFKKDPPKKFQRIQVFGMVHKSEVCRNHLFLLVCFTVTSSFGLSLLFCYKSRRFYQLVKTDLATHETFHCQVKTRPVFHKINEKLQHSKQWTSMNPGGGLIMQYGIQQAGDSSSDEWLRRLHSALTQSLWASAPKKAEGTPLPSPHSSSNEDQRRGYQALNQPQVHFTYVLMNLRSCAEPLRAQGIAPPMPYQHSSEDTVNKTAWAIADRRRLDTHRQHIGVWSCDIRRAGGGIVYAIMITCCNLSWGLLNSQLLQWS